MRNILIYFAIRYQGDYHLMMEAIKRKENIDIDELERIKNEKVEAITILDKEYPAVLKEIFCPPLVLFYKGDKTLLSPSRKKLSVVGTRKPSLYGEEAITKILNELYDLCDVVIVSGLAKGIDSIAHISALSSHQKTIAILGCGIDECYPLINEEIYNQIAEEGLLLSEYPFSSKPKKDNFPMRNRIISALGNALLIGEAKFKSGTQITLRYALEQGKDVFAIPHSIFEESFCNQIIKQGAFLVTSGRDIFENLYNL